MRNLVLCLLLAVGTAFAQGQVVVSCSGSPKQCDGSPLTPDSALDFGYVSDGSTASVKFTVINNSQSAVAVSLQGNGMFSSDPSAPVPAAVAGGASSTFTVDFSPTSTMRYTATLVVGSTSLGLEGTGVDNTPGGPVPFKFVYCDVGCASTMPLFTPWSFPDTPDGEENYLTLRAVNPTSSNIKFISASLSDSQNFTLTNVSLNELIPASKIGTPFLIHFTPRQTGSLKTVLSVTSCLPDSSGLCPAGSNQTETVAEFDGNGTAPQVVLSCSGSLPACNGSLLTPESVLDFGDVADGSTASVQFTVKNGSQLPVSVSLQTAAGSPFLSDSLAPVPSTVPAGGSTAFAVDFSPNQAALAQAMIVVHPVNDSGMFTETSYFPLQGTGVAGAIAGLSSLAVSYSDTNGTHQIAPGGTIDFGQVAAGTPATLQVSVCNPQSTNGTVIVPVPVISGSGFSASGLPSAPIAIQAAAAPPYCQPGSGTVSFQIAFTAPAAGTYSGQLLIGDLKFSLSAQAVLALLPAMSFQLSQQPLTSQQQVNLAVQLASPSPIQAIGTLTMTFTPSVQNVSDDPAIQFLATNSRTLNVNVSAGSQSVTFNGQSAIAFQTGTTAGTIALTLQFPNTPPLTQSFAVLPDKVHIASATATINSSNLVITIDGYDNTYSTGQLSFTFYDSKGNTIAPGAIAVNATSQFQQYFFNNNHAGGAFALQATFPVYNGTATQVSSVSVTMTNSFGSVTTTQTFQ